MRQGVTVLVIALVASGATASATAPDQIVPFQQVNGMRLGMTASQAKQGVGEQCPTLTARTRRDRVKYPCYFTTAPAADGEVELIYASRARGCGADATLLKGRLLDVSSPCPGTIRGGPGTGSSFKDMYASFRAGSVRCIKGGQFQHKCSARRQTRSGVFYTEFNDGKPIDQRPPLVVFEVMVGKCRGGIFWTGPHNTASPNPCSRNFGVRARFRGEFRP